MTGLFSGDLQCIRYQIDGAYLLLPISRGGMSSLDSVICTGCKKQNALLLMISPQPNMSMLPVITYPASSKKRQRFY